VKIRREQVVTALHDKSDMIQRIEMGTRRMSRFIGHHFCRDCGRGKLSAEYASDRPAHIILDSLMRRRRQSLATLTLFEGKTTIRRLEPSLNYVPENRRYLYDIWDIVRKLANESETACEAKVHFKIDSGRPPAARDILLSFSAGTRV
jgi:protocatechuate 3,4-dioxygenase beta subunit